MPDHVFDDTRRVRDEKAYRIGRNGRISIEVGEPEGGGVNLLLESPHRDEFDGPGGPALGPLRNPKVRAVVEEQLPRLIREVEALLGRSLVDEPVVLVNAVQYQTSLQSMMADYGGGLRSGVRTPVWHAIYDCGGAADLLARLDQYEPSVVLSAPTGKVRRAVERSMMSHVRDWPWIAVDSHPSFWGRRRPMLSGTVHASIACVGQIRDMGSPMDR